MPTYEVQDPETGKTLRLEGDQPPTEQELDAIFSEYRGATTQQPTAEQPLETQQSPEASAMAGAASGASAISPVTGAITGAAETAATIGSGLVSEIGAGWRGLAALASGQDLSEATELMGETREALQYIPKTEQGKSATEAAGGVFQKLGEVAKFAPSKLISYLSNPFDAQAAAQLDEDLRTRPVGEVAGEAAFEVTGSPALATLAETAPTIAESLIPAGAAGVGARSARGTMARRAEEGVEAAEQEAARAGVQQSGRAAQDQTAVQRTAQQIQKASPEEVAAMVDADPRILESIEALEIEAEPIYSQLSRNPQYREVEGGLRAMPGSDLNAQAVKFIDETKQKADELIETFGGVRDKALLSSQFREDSLKTIDDLRESANEVYSQIDSELMKNEQAIPSSTLSFIMQQADEAGGVNELSGRLKSLYGKLRGKEVSKGKTERRTDPLTMQTRTVTTDPEIKNPTIGQIDMQRKLIGQALSKKSGPFADMEEGQLKALYGRLTDDMNSILDEKGLQGISDQAKSLVKERKLLEGNLQDLLGKQLTKDLSSVIGTATKGLAQGRTQQFIDTVNKIPKAYRQKAVVSSLNDVFRGRGQGMESFNANDYLKFWNELGRNKKAKSALFKELPKGSRGALAGLANIARGINQADRTVIRTGIIQSFFEPNTGLVSKMLGNAGRALTAAKAGPAGSALYSAVSDMLSQSTSPAQRTAALIATPGFQTVVKKAINERVNNPEAASESLKAAEKSLRNSKQYKEWVNSLPEADKMAAQAGLLTYLATVGAQESNDNTQ